MMNERIRELAEQATKGADWKPGLGNPHVQDYMEKFAELIVNECLQYLESEIDRRAEYRDSLEEWDNNRKEDVDLSIEKCYDNIEGLKQLFGVNDDTA